MIETLARLALVLAAPMLLGWRRQKPGWLILVLALGSWAAIGWLTLLPLGLSLRQTYQLLLAINLAMVAVAFAVPGRPWRSLRRDYQLRQGFLAVVAPSLLCAMALWMRGVIVEFPSDGFVYYFKYYAADLLGTVQFDPLHYRSPQNWFFTSASFLFDFPGSLSLDRVSLLASLNTFLVLLASCQLCFRLTGRILLGWLCALLFLLGMGHQSFSFFHQIALNGTLPGFALVIAAATPLFTALQGPAHPRGGALVRAALPLLAVSFLAYHAHGVTAYVSFNLLVATAGAALILGPVPLRFRVAGSVLVLLLVFLQRLPWPANLQEFYAWPESMRFLHDYHLFGHRFFYFWPSRPVATWEPVFLGALLLSWAVLFNRRGWQAPGAGAVLALALLPSLVLLEWWMPFVNDIVFKLIEPDNAYRLVWTSLFWIGIPVMALSLDDRWQGVHRRGLQAAIFGLLAILAVPVHVRERTNIFSSKVPHLITPLAEVRASDGFGIEPILPRLAALCRQFPQLRGEALLSDPFVGTVVAARQCLIPVAERDITKLDATVVEAGQYPGLADAMTSSRRLNTWFDRHRVGVLLLRDDYIPYESRIAMASSHWQPDLVSTYEELALNRLTPAQLRASGFQLVSREQGFRIYLRVASPAR